jgi:hypothetical protein
MTLDCETIQGVMDEVWTIEMKAERLDALMDERLKQAARDLTSMAVLEWNWPKREVAR